MTHGQAVATALAMHQQGWQAKAIRHHLSTLGYHRDAETIRKWCGGAYEDPRGQEKLARLRDWYSRGMPMTKLALVALMEWGDELTWRQIQRAMSNDVYPRRRRMTPPSKDLA